jgi:putative ATP-dependent endonuclease of the OLD family
MKLQHLQIRNYRTLEAVTLSFPTFYCAISGKNDCGKTNVLQAVRGLFKYDPYPFIEYSERRHFSLKDDFPRWLSKETSQKVIEIQVELHIFRDSDEGLHQFLVDYLDLKDPKEVLPLKVKLSISDELADGTVAVTVNGLEADTRKAAEVLKKLQSSSAVLFHNSLMPEVPFFISRRTGLLEIAPEERQKLDAAKTRLNAALATVAKHHQKRIEELLGRLQDKHKIGFSLSKFEMDEFPYSLTLGEGDIPIERWGGGTQNRTNILMTLLKARQITETPTSPSKITPILIVEEPESFLHPSAQGEFGRLLQCLAEEFKVQVIVATHSPYMLSMGSQESNILLTRKADKGKLRATSVADTTGDQWMEPFGLALGLDNNYFVPWKTALFSKSEEILLVEGDTDKSYFEMLQAQDHGAARLQFEGCIFPYGGRDNLKSRALLKLIKSRFKKFIITYDLDSDRDLSKLLDDLGFQKNKNYFAIGLPATGKETIEGLLPDSVLKAVYGREIELVQQMGSGIKEQRDSAKNKVKQMLLEEFKKLASPGSEFYGHFYVLAKKINAALKAS